MSAGFIFILISVIKILLICLQIDRVFVDPLISRIDLLIYRKSLNRADGRHDCRIAKTVRILRYGTVLASLLDRFLLFSPESKPTI